MPARLLRDRLLTEANVRRLVGRANALLADEAARPAVDAAPLRAELKAQRARRDRLARALGDDASDDADLLVALKEQVKAAQRRINELGPAIRAAETRAARQGSPLDLARVGEYLADLRGLLAQETPRAAEFIRALTGPITVTQAAAPRPGRKRVAWVATFRPRLGAALSAGGAPRGCAEAAAALRAADPPAGAGAANGAAASAAEVDAGLARVTIDHTPKHERWADVIGKMLAAGDGDDDEADGRGRNPHRVAAALGIPYDLARKTARFAATGERPTHAPPGRRRAWHGPRNQPKYVRLAAEAARLRDVEGLTRAEAAAQLGINRSTLDRAYAHHHRSDPSVSDDGTRRLAPLLQF